MREIGDMPHPERALHALNRVAFGPRPGDIELVRRIGAERYIEEQLHPESIPIPSDLVDKVASYRTLRMSPLALFKEYHLPVIAARRENRGADKSVIQSAVRNARLKQRAVALEAIEARIVRAIYGPRQLQEVMTAFWFNHFNVFVGKGLDTIWTGSFEEQAIRPHTMGRFRDLLGATARHPAMLFYLDNWQNTAPGSPGAKGKFDGINENYARELMELHTLGVNGGYTQADVTTLAHILTGWGITKPGIGAMIRNGLMEPNPRAGFGPFGGMRRAHPRWNRRHDQPAITPALFYFDSTRHDFGSKTFLGHTIDGSGASEVEHALDILARHPSTSRHLSYQLAQYFVADNPPEPLVDRMSARYMATDGDIRQVLATMFSSPEFWDRRYFAAKFKTPYEYVISCARATGVHAQNYRPLYGTMALLGMPIYGCLTPNGYSNTQESWLNPDAMMTRLSFATALGSGNLPLDHPPFKEFQAMRELKAAGERRDMAHPDVSAIAHPRGPKMTPPDPVELSQTFGGAFSSSTSEAVESAPMRLRSALMLGSPEFMKR